MSGGFHGEIIGPTSKDVFAAGLEQEKPEESDQFAGMGPWLEGEDADVFKSVEGMVLRQEILALNHLAQDTHWTYLKLGYPWSTLTKEPNRDRYVQALPYGSAGVTIQAVPNKAWDLINKTTEALLVDFPQAECEPGSDDEKAQAACDMGNRFLAQDASEQGTNDAVLFNDRVSRALTCASSYIECWTDPTGNGYVPLQIPAHPQAVSPKQPLVGPDGMPTTSPVLRYVTEVGPDGQPTETSQFTTDATKAAPQWQPKLRAAKWQREHIRVYPETATVDQAEKVIVLGYCTLGEAKRRWQQVSQMTPDELSKLTDWTPTRYLALLPLFQRGRWKLTDGRDKEKQGASDERIMFYYHPFVKACPDYRKGADVVVTGAMGGMVLDRKFLSQDVEVPAKPDPQNPQAPATKKETRCLEIPIVQITPRGDPDEQDPTGRAYIELFAGAVENNAHLAMSASEVIDKNLHLEGYSSSTSPIDGQARENARATGDLLRVIRKDDVPVWGQPIPFENAFFTFYKDSSEAIESIGSANKAAKGQEGADEKSGRAIALATANNNVSLGGMNHAVNNAYARWERIKTERMMCDFTTAQQINYVGEDGIFKSEDLNASDFALIGKITIKAGTGGLVSPDQKIQNLAGLAQGGLLSPDEARDAARPSFSRRLGLNASPAEQRIERQITAFLKGMPSPEWAAQWQEYQQAKAAYDQQMAAYEQQQLGEQQRLQGEAAAAPERAKAESALTLEREKHRMAQEARQTEQASQPPMAPAPVAPPIDPAQIAQQVAALLPQPSASAQPPVALTVNTSEVEQPKTKRTTITKNPDGSMTAVTVEEPTPLVEAGG